MNRDQQDSYFHKCMETLVATDIPKAEKYCEILEKRLSNFSTDSHLSMLVKLTRGACLVRLGADPHRSVRLLSQAASAARNESDSCYFIEAQRYLGICLRNLGDFEAATNAFQQAIDAAKQAGKLDARLLISFANVLGEAEQLYEAERIFEQALTLTRLPKDKIIISNITANLAALYEMRSRLMPGPNAPHDIAKSITYGRAALESVMTWGNEETISRYKANLALYTAMHSKSAANIEAIYDHIKLLRSNNNLTSEALTWGNLSMIYAHVGDANQALSCAETAIKISDEVGSNTRKAESYFLLSKAFELKGELRLALNALQEHVRLNDSENKRRASQAGIVLMLQTALDEAQQELASTQANNQANENYKQVTIEIMNSLPQGIILLSTDGNIIYKNKATTQILATMPLDEMTQFLAPSLTYETVEHWDRKGIHVVKRSTVGTIKSELKSSTIAQWRILTRHSQCDSQSSAVTLHYDFDDIEKIIVEELLKGESNINMCAKLNIKTSALQSHLVSIYKKIGANNKRQAIEILIK